MIVAARTSAAVSRTRARVMKWSGADGMIMAQSLSQAAEILVNEALPWRDEREFIAESWPSANVGAWRPCLLPVSALGTRAALTVIQTH
ncbi:MAG: hypothetical protein KKB67_07885, partial [Alphaproteobacteria bacterium]|nr:hypothetical protein [Alphaproteobacteria bacterium]